MYSLTSKSQVTVPAEVRKKLGLNKGDRIRFNMQGNKVSIERVMTMQEVAADLQADLKRRGFNKIATQEDYDNARDTFYKNGGTW